MSEPIDPNDYPPQDWPPPDYPTPGYPPQPGYTTPGGYPVPTGYTTPGGYPIQPGSPLQAGYPSQQWVPQPGWAQPNWTPPAAPAPRRRRVVVIGAVAVLVLALVGVVAYFATGSNSSDKHVAVPASFAGYTQLHNDIATRVESVIRDVAKDAGGSEGAQMFQAATVAVYAHDSGDLPVLIVMVFPTPAASSTSASPDVSAELLSGAAPDAGLVEPGRHGGTARCGSTMFGTAAETMCAWSDQHLSGMLVSVHESKTPAGLADLMRTFRDLVE
jgi:hypothetical protein